MMRKLSSLLVAGVLAVAFAAPASSATLTASGNLGVILGALPPISIDGGPIGIDVSSGGGFTIPESMFKDAIVLAPQLFTGVSLISSLNVAATNLDIAVDGAGAAVGTVVGETVVGVLGGLVNLNIDLNVGGGGVATGGAAALAITVTNSTGWTTGAVSVTGITTTTDGTAVLNTLVSTGSDNRTAGHNGSITIVTPVRVLTNAAGNLPLIGRIALTFEGGMASAPEPGTLLLLGSGFAGLVIVGRRKLKK